MNFKDLKVNDQVYILENAGTFIKTNTYHVGTVALAGPVYDENPMQAPNPYMANAMRKKLVDITISCNGVQKKLTVNAEKNILNDNTIGLTVATDKKDLVTQLTQQYNECQAKIASIEYYKNEADKCKRILDQITSSQPSEIPSDTIKVD